MKTVLKIDASDNVAVALAELPAGTEIADDDGVIGILERIPEGHKVALRQMHQGDPVLKYGEVIGVATADISAGTHVHVHNVRSARLPGPEVAQ